MEDGNVRRVIDHNERVGELTKESASADLPSTDVSSPSPLRSLGNHSSEILSNSQQEKESFVRYDLMESTEDHRKEQRVNAVTHGVAHRFSQQPATLGGRDELQSCSGSSTDKIEESFVGAFGNLSIQCAYTPQQECRSHFGDSGYSGLVQSHSRKGNVNNESFFDHVQLTHESQLSDICLFKRRIIERDGLEHSLYIIPIDKFHEVFPKIKRDEALVYHGTEFPVGEEHQTMNFNSLHQLFLITDNVTVSFEVLRGQKFSVISPPTTPATVSEIYSKSEERIASGFSVKVLTRCTGGKNDLYQDIMKVKLQSGSRTLHLVFPVAYYETSASHWLYDSVSVTPTCMPEEDREALRSCHVALLDNIGDVISLCEYLYQHRILDDDDLEEIRNIPKKRDRNAHVLRTLQTRGNILDFVITVMQAQRPNQGAATILQKRRYLGADM